MNAKTVADRWSKNVIGEIIGSKYPTKLLLSVDILILGM